MIRNIDYSGSVIKRFSGFLNGLSGNVNLYRRGQGNLEIFSNVRGNYFVDGDITLHGKLKGGTLHATGKISTDANSVVNGNLISEQGEISIFGTMLKNGFAKAKKRIITGGDSKVSGQLESNESITLFGKTKATAKSPKVFVYGNMNGITQADEVHVKEGGKLGGTVITKELITEKGAHLLDNLKAFVEHYKEFIGAKKDKGLLKISKSADFFN